MDDSFDNEYELVSQLPSQHVFCTIFSYAFHYHVAVAKFELLSTEALKQLEKGASEALNELCVKDRDFVTMFELMGSMKGLGLRSDRIRYDIEFPTRNHLKVLLARLIAKRRKQVELRLTDLHQQNNTAIVSSTDTCEDNVVSHLCKNIYPKEQEELIGGFGLHAHEVSKGKTDRHAQDAFSNALSSPGRFTSRAAHGGLKAQTTRRIGLKKQEDDVKLEQEVIISAWIDEVDLQLKTYDIVSMMRNPEDYQCQMLNNEIFNVAQQTESIRVLQNPRNRNKTLTCMVPMHQSHESRLVEEVNKVRARKYASDHRDNLLEKKIPSGYKLIGVKGFKNTHDNIVLHIADFIIWKPPPGWLDISPEGLALQEAARLEAARKKQLGITGQSWLSGQNLQPKNFLKLNHERLKTQQVNYMRQKQEWEQDMQIKALKTHGLFSLRKQQLRKHNPSQQLAMGSNQKLLKSSAGLSAFEMSHSQGWATGKKATQQYQIKQAGVGGGGTSSYYPRHTSHSGFQSSIQSPNFTKGLNHQRQGSSGQQTHTQFLRVTKSLSQFQLEKNRSRQQDPHLKQVTPRQKPTVTKMLVDVPSYQTMVHKHSNHGTPSSHHAATQINLKVNMGGQRMVDRGSLFGKTSQGQRAGGALAKPGSLSQQLLPQIGSRP